MNHIVLLGAGFTRNWGGWLANEVFEFLIGTPELLADAGLRQMLWRHRLGGFEDALSELQRAILAPANRGSEEGLSYWDTNNKIPLRDHFIKLQTAVRRMFSDMNNAITSGFESESGRNQSIGQFLARFDAVFTLNQDLFLESLYVPYVKKMNSGRWKGASLPGIRQGDRATEKSGELYSSSEYSYQPRPREEFAVEADLQPIFKLHGSSNWFTAGGDPMLIIGGEKTRAISQFELLAWYAQEFERRLSEGIRVMVIGYGFRDRHINDAFARAAEKGLQLFVVDPFGSELGERADSWSVSATRDVQQLFERALIGASRRNITETLRENGAEYKKLLRFMES